MQSREAMPVRDFTDPDGISWRVWDTVPEADSLMARSFPGGWLTFESSVGKRRLIPIPEGWERVSAARLRLYCRVAAPTRNSGEFRAIPEKPEVPDRLFDEPPGGDVDRGLLE